MERKENHDVKSSRWFRLVVDSFFFKWWNSIEKELQDTKLPRCSVKAMLYVCLVLGHPVAASTHWYRSKGLMHHLFALEVSPEKALNPTSSLIIQPWVEKERHDELLHTALEQEPIEEVILEFKSRWGFAGIVPDSCLWLGLRKVKNESLHNCSREPSMEQIRCLENRHSKEPPARPRWNLSFNLILFSTERDDWLW